MEKNQIAGAKGICVCGHSAMIHLHSCMKKNCACSGYEEKMKNLIQLSVDNLKKNQKVQVSADAPFHAGEIGYFQFYGYGPSEGCVVLAVRPNVNPLTLFSIADQHICAVYAIEDEEI